MRVEKGARRGAQVVQLEAPRHWNRAAPTSMWHMARTRFWIHASLRLRCRTSSCIALTLRRNRERDVLDARDVRVRGRSFISRQGTPTDAKETGASWFRPRLRRCLPVGRDSFRRNCGSRLGLAGDTQSYDSCLIRVFDRRPDIPDAETGGIGALKRSHEKAMFSGTLPEGACGTQRGFPQKIQVTILPVRISQAHAE